MNKKFFRNMIPVVAAPENFPVFEDNGAIAAGQDSGVAVPFMGTINQYDILFIQMLDADDDSFTTPAGGWQRVNEHKTDTNLSDGLFWLRATGSETGTVTVNSLSDTGLLVAGIMSRWSGCKRTGTPFEASNLAGITQSQYPVVSETTTLGGKRLIANFVQVGDNTTMSALASGYSLAFNVSTSVGSDGRLAAQWQQVESATTISEETGTIAVAEYWGSFTLALIPES